MRKEFNAEEEMKMYDNGSSPQSSTILPYHFDDDEGHLVLNDNFYVQTPLNVAEDLDPFDDSHFEPGSPFQCMKADVKVHISEVQRSETESEVSTEVSGPPMDVPTAMESVHTLDAQLDFIMETTKKQQKPREKSHRRNRKTRDQLKILIDDLGDVEHAERGLIKQVAAKTGLTELQVYKWYWDRRSKN
eukprot:TRINITY_DN1454_c0_g1_i6.p2 TRINITY_DN1454_c0_g1~~TRINITY_DN1454_c0_g1_i6.p2  ORF type:complete len:219 (-),score=74.49 TRINITY_DN1454_c0_g1_i6:209-775(-)